MVGPARAERRAGGAHIFMMTASCASVKFCASAPCASAARPSARLAAAARDRRWLAMAMGGALRGVEGDCMSWWVWECENVCCSCAAPCVLRVCSVVVRPLVLSFEFDCATNAVFSIFVSRVAVGCLTARACALLSQIRPHPTTSLIIP